MIRTFFSTGNVPAPTPTPVAAPVSEPTAPAGAPTAPVAAPVAAPIAAPVEVPTAGGESVFELIPLPARHCLLVPLVGHYYIIARGVRSIKVRWVWCWP